MTIIDINKKYQTKSGRNVRIYTTSAEGRYPVHAAVELKDYPNKGDHEWDLLKYTEDGQFSPETGISDFLDLVELDV